MIYYTTIASQFLTLAIAKNLSSQSQAVGCVAIDNPSSTATISWRRTCFFPEMRKKNQHFDKVRRYSKSLFLLTDFCKATHPTATKRVDREQMVAIANQLLSLTYTYARGEFEDAIDEYLSQLPGGEEWNADS